jgi:hypothetical protein
MMYKKSIDVSKIMEATSSTVVGNCYLCKKKITIGYKPTVGGAEVDGKAEIYHDECMERKLSRDARQARRTLVRMLALSGSAEYASR